MRDFEVSILTLRQRGVGLERFAFAAAMAGLAVTSSRVEAAEPIVVNGVVEAAGEGMLVSIEVETRWHGECVRCLDPAEGPLRVTARELFREGPTTDDTYGYHGDVLDLSELVHDLVILELPVLPLCRVDCRGLCPSCGANHNVEQCTCAPLSASAFAVLDTLESVRGDHPRVR